jgi:hypothetical protein
VAWVLQSKGSEEAVGQGLLYGQADRVVSWEQPSGDEKSGGEERAAGLRQGCSQWRLPSVKEL